MTKIEEVGIDPGFGCNFSCAHCLLDNGLRKSRRGVSQRETAQICSAIAELKPKRIAFSGGEPTLYIEKINGILRAVDAFADVRIITNGHFAKDAVSALKTIRAFHRLDAVQMSYDKFHKPFSSLSRVRALFNACKKADLRFSVVVSVSSPLDMIVLKELRGVGDFDIKVQKVLPIGIAKKNQFYYKYPGFDKNVLLKKCPNLGRVFYACGKGFSVCCSTLVYGGRDRVGRKYIHPSVREHFDSEFYKLISSMNFYQLAKYLKVGEDGFTEEESAPCSLCATVFKRSRIWNS